MQQSKKTDRKKKLATFIEEIGAIYEEEKRERKMAHFTNSRFKPHDLTWEDKSMWDKIKDKSVRREDINSYRELIVDSVTRKLRPDIPQSRYTFLAFVENKAAPIIGWREMNEAEG